MVDYDVDDDTDASVIAGGDHAGELVPVSTLADQLRRDTLVRGPPLGSGDMLGRTG
jgi:hypothetical protein